MPDPGEPDFDELPTRKEAVRLFTSLQTTNAVEVKIKKLPGCFKLPEYATGGSAGMDLYATELKVINPGEIKLIGTGIAIQLSSGYEGQVRSRSGLAVKAGVAVVNGVGTIDSDYSGEVKVGLINHGVDPYVVSPGDRIAQLVIAQVPRVNLTVVEELDATARGDGGFGSTGS